MKSKVVAAIYTRVSTDEQKNHGYSLEAQESILREYAIKKGYEVYDVYCDGGYSGKDFNRPNVQRLFKDLENDKIDVILVWKVDRLSRNDTDVLVLIDNVLTPRDKKLIITSIDMDASTPSGRMFISLLSTFARYERSTIIDRLNMGMQKRAEKGLWNGGTILGYDSIDKKLVINEQESKIVKEIFEMRAQGKGYKIIVNTLNNRGAKTKTGKNFSIAGVKQILNNQMYIGKMVWRKHKDWNTKRRAGKTEPLIVDGVHEGIIEPELWLKVQEVNEIQNKTFTTNRNFKGNFFLTGILKCPKCGSGTVMMKTRKGKSNDYHLYYMCQAYHSKGITVCNTNLIKKEDVEQKVLNEISFLVNNEEIFDKLICELDEENNRDNGVAINEIFCLKKQLKSLFNKRSKLDTDYFDEKIESGTYNRLVNNLNMEIDKIETNIRKAESEIQVNDSSINKDELLYALKNFNKLFSIINDEEKKLLVRSLIKEIQMTDDRKDVKEITFWFSSVPNLPSNKVSRTVSQVIVNKKNRLQLKCID